MFPKINIRRILLLFITTVSFSSCATMQGNVSGLLRKSAVLNSHFTGFALYDLDMRRSVVELNAHKYFTPASNTKLFTFYTSLMMLGDSIPGLKYIIKNDSLLFWPTGDPSFLHPELKGVNAFKFLESRKEKLVYCTGAYQNRFYGSGWAWDDYNDYYQAEINDLPLYGNTVYFHGDALNRLNVEPPFFKKYCVEDSLSKPSFTVKRDLDINKFRYPPPAAVSKSYRQWVPFKTSDTLTAKLLADTLKREIGTVKMAVPANAKTIFNANADTVYRHMLQPSDNFIAEQLLLVCSAQKWGYMNTDSVRQYAIQTFLKDLPDKPQWNDGSGLSRLNLFTPASIIGLLQKIKAKVGNDDLLFSLMPAGGITGTLRAAYKIDNGKPFVYAKTGSLSNNYNQSGYLITKKGKKFAFSFMNNNYTETSRTLRDEMVRIITYIHNNY